MVRYFLTPAAARDPETASEVIDRQLKAGSYSWGENTPYVRDLQPGDRVAFYASGTSRVVAEAEVTSRAVHTQGSFPWRFGVTPGRSVVPSVRIDADLRARLDAFRGKDAQSTRWSWFVQVTREVSAHDFRLLTGD